MKRIIFILLAIIFICLTILATLFFASLENQETTKKKSVNSQIDSVKNSFCGDGIRNGDEECDGTQNCNSNCEIIPPAESVCGDYFCSGKDNYFNCPNDCDAPEQQSFQPVHGFAEKAEKLVNDPRIQNAIKASSFRNNDLVYQPIQPLFDSYDFLDDFRV